MQKLTIARLAKGAGVGVETVRYYQRRALMPVPKTSGEGAYRTYDEEHVQRLRFIRRAQAAGFTLEEIGELLEADPLADRARVHEFAAASLKALAAQQAELDAARAALERLVGDCERSRAKACPIIGAFAPEAADG
jgi:MerR family mercuric resistance operon transcriptional regulator